MAKRVLMLLVVAFAVFYLLSQPVAAADSVKVAAGGIGDAFHQIGRFLREVTG